MRKVAGFLAIAAVSLVSVMVGARQPAHAEIMTWKVTNAHPNSVQIVLYSQTRRGHSWPGGGAAYDLTRSAEETIGITCEAQEKICYGAWVTGNQRTYWGLGYGGDKGCEKCCYVCQGNDVTVRFTQ